MNKQYLTHLMIFAIAAFAGSARAGIEAGRFEQEKRCVLRKVWGYYNAHAFAPEYEMTRLSVAVSAASLVKMREEGSGVPVTLRGRIEHESTGRTFDVSGFAEIRFFYGLVPPTGERPFMDCEIATASASTGADFIEYDNAPGFATCPSYQNQTTLRLKSSASGLDLVSIDVGPENHSKRARLVEDYPGHYLSVCRD